MISYPSPLPRKNHQAKVSHAPALQLADIHAGYGKKEILHGMSLAVDEGEIITLLGGNGAGKSTSLKTAIGLLRPHEGAVYMNGVDITRVSLCERVRAGLGYLMQGGEVFSSLTVYENIEFGAHQLPKTNRSHSLTAVLDTFPVLQGKQGVRAGLLSGGQRQALALAMVLAQEPKILLLDEPSAGCAPHLAHDILRKIVDLNQRCGTTVILVEQRVREALAVAHRAVVLVNGAVASETTAPSQWLEEGALNAHFFASKSESPKEGNA